MTRPDECAQIEELIPEFLAGRVAAEDDERIRRHLESCEECRKRANAVSLLQQTPIPRPDPGRWDDFVRDVVDVTGRRRSARRRHWLLGAAAVVALGSALVVGRVALGPDQAPVGLEGLAHEVAELSDLEAAAWTAGLSPAGFMPAGFDTVGLSEEQIEKLATEVGRT